MSALNELYQEISVCRKCDIAAGRNRVVPGEGAENAQIMFIGEAPGWHEDQQGRPFVGPAGQFLDRLLASVELRRETVYITNIIKTRPPNNRDPLPQEIMNCKPWLDCQIKIIHPRVIVTLGRLSMALYFPGKTISQIHGMAYEKGGVMYFPMYHPAAALHQPALRETLHRDMLKLPLLLEELRAQQPREHKADVKQLNLL